jgi:hypothetical protein
MVNHHAVANSSLVSSFHEDDGMLERSLAGADPRSVSVSIPWDHGLYSSPWAYSFTDIIFRHLDIPGTEYDARIIMPCQRPARSRYTTTYTITSLFHANTTLTFLLTLIQQLCYLFYFILLSSLDTNLSWLFFILNTALSIMYQIIILFLPISLTTISILYVFSGNGHGHSLHSRLRFTFCFSPQHMVFSLLSSI